MSGLRPLSLHERFCVARRNLGFLPRVTAAAILELDSPQSEVDPIAELSNQLLDRINLLLTRFPLLRCGVVESQARTPRWHTMDPPPTASQILHNLKPSSDTFTEDNDTETMLGNVIAQEHASFTDTSDIEVGPLWRVAVYPLPGHDGTRCVVALTCDHVINDGKGTMNLFHLLLQSESPTTFSEPSASKDAIPPSSDEIFDFRPSARHMARVVFKELLLPSLPLPGWIKTRLLGPAPWPCTPVRGLTTSRADQSGSATTLVQTPRDCSPVLKILLFSGPGLLDNLKILAKKSIDGNNNKTDGKIPKAASLHAIVHSLAMVAVFAALVGSNNKVEELQDDLDKAELTFASETPISLRLFPPDSSSFNANKSDQDTLAGANEDESSIPALPETTGNFVSDFEYKSVVRGSDAFWTLTNQFAQQLGSKEGKTLAKYTMGMLAYIPDPPPASDSDKLKGFPTGWEKYFGEKLASPHPYGSAIEVSNLGLADISSLESSPKKETQSVEDGGREGFKRRVVACSWAQFASPMGAAFNIDVLGYSSRSSTEKDQIQTLSLALGARPTAFADPDLFGRFETYLRRLVPAFAAAARVPQGDQLANLASQRNVTLGALTKALVLPH